MAWIDRQSRRWRVRARVNGSAVTFGTYNTKVEARHRADEVTQLLALGIDPRFRKVNKGESLAKYFADYLNHDCLHLAERTRNQRFMVLQAFHDFVRGRAKGASPLALNRDNIRLFYQNQMARGLSPNTGSKYVSHLHTAWKSIDLTVSDQNIIHRFHPIRVPTVATGIEFTPTLNEVDLFIAMLPREDWRRVATLARYTGLRNSQLAQLLWGDVDLGRGIICIRPELGKSKQESRGRFIPINKDLRLIMASWSPLLRANKPNTDLIAWAQAQPLLQREVRGKTYRKRCRLSVAHNKAGKVVTDSWRDIWQRSGAVRPYHGKFKPLHAFRRFFTTYLLSQGAQYPLIKQLLGQSSSLERAYLDQVMPVLQDIVDLIPPIRPGSEILSDPNFHNTPAIWSKQSESIIKRCAPKRDRTSAARLTQKLP